MAQSGGKAEVSSRSKTHALFAAFTIGMSAAFLLCGYEFVRSTSNTLFKEHYGKEGLPNIMALMPLGVIAMLYVYGRLLSWLGPRRTLLVTTLASAAGIAGCYLAIRSGVAPARGVLYILREAYVVLLIEQYWSFLNSTLGTDAAKKLNGPICGVASIGAVLGGMLVYRLSEELGTPAMLLFGAAACVPAAVLSEIAYRRCGEPEREGTTDEHRSTQVDGRKGEPCSSVSICGSPQSGHLGLSLFGSHRMLPWLFLVVVATQILSTSLDLAFQGILQDAIPARDAQNAYSGLFFAFIAAAAAFAQFVLAPLLLRYAPLGVIHAAIPLIHIVACGWLFAAPSLTTAGVAYLIFKTLDYSVFRAAKEILYIPFPFDVRYRAKEVIDVFGYRFSKGGTSLFITLAQKPGVAFSASTYALAAVAAACGWLALIVPAISAYKRVHTDDRMIKNS